MHIHIDTHLHMYQYVYIHINVHTYLSSTLLCVSHILLLILKDKAQRMKESIRIISCVS